MHLGQVWRYPVKSMAGESLISARIGRLGLEGDRLVQVHDGRGRVITARSHPRLLGQKATIGTDGQPRVNGRPWDDRAVAEVIRTIAGPGAALVPARNDSRFDVLPLLIATDGALAAFGRDPRRLRPNLVIEGVDGLAERGWPGRMLRIGHAVVRIHGVRQRCIMTTYDPDSQVRDLEVLRDIVRRFGGRLALDAEVVEPGRVAVGDPVELLAQPMR